MPVCGAPYPTNPAPLKKHTMSFRLTILLFLSVIGLSALQAKEPPARPNPPRLVNDFTGVLGGQDAALEQKLVAYNDSTSTQIAVVIESTIDGDDVFDYSYRLARAWGIGQKEKDNGILIFVAIEDRKLYILTGYGAEGFLPDAMSKRIIENVIKPAFREGRYYAGLDEATNIIMQLGSGEYTAEPRKEGGGFPWMTILIVLGLLIFLSMFMGQGGNRHRNDDDDDGGYWRGGRYDMGPRPGGGWVIFPGGGGGGSGGGGGGFGGFGGGDFGGGGAGGSW